MKRRYPILVSLILAMLLMASLWVAAGAAENRGGNLYGYVGTSTDDELVVFDLSTNDVVPPDIDLLPNGNYPYDITLNGDGSEVWIAGASGEGVVVVDTTSNTIIQNIPNLGDYPVDVIFGRDGNFAYVSNRDTVDDITIVDTSTYTAVGTINVPDSSLGPGKMAVNHCNGDLYAVNWFDDQFYLIDTVGQTVSTTLTLGADLWDLTIDPAATTLYVADRGLDQVHVIDIATMTSPTSIAVGEDPWGIDITPDGRFVLVANEDSHDITVIDANLNVVTDTIILAADADPRDLDITADGQFAYVPSGDIAGTDAVYVIDLNTMSITDTIPINSANPNALAVAPNFAAVGPTAAFTHTTPVTANIPVQFTDQSANAVSWNWDFGDGGMSTAQHPTHTYTMTGVYTVTLTATNSCGSAMASTTIEVEPGMIMENLYLPAVLKE